MNEDRMREIATEVYQTLGTRFGMNQTPVHTHNGIDTPTLLTSSLNGVSNLSFQGTGVLSPANLGSGKAYWGQLNGKQTQFPVFPIIVIDTGTFNGGTAPEGTLIGAHSNGAYQLYFRYNGAWHGVTLPLSA